MLINSNLNKSSNINYSLIFLLAFFTGLINSSDYMSFLGLNNLNSIIRIIFYVLLLCISLLIIISRSLSRDIIRISSNFIYWIFFLFAVLFKLFLLFIQNPSWVLPGGLLFSDYLNFLLIIFLLIIFSVFLKNFQDIKMAVWGLGIGASFSALIPLMYPEMIGSRSGIFQGYYFSGGFWNSSVIAYISVGWLLVSLTSLENKRIKKVFLISLFLIMLFGGLAGLSRATLVSAIISVCVYLLFARKFKKYLKIILSFAVVLIAIINFFPEIITNFSDRLEGGIDISEESRTKIWFDYLEDLPSYFVFGAIDGDYTKYSSYGIRPHSSLLNWLVQFGIFGLMGFVMLIIGLILSIRRIGQTFNYEASSALYAWLSAYLSVALVNETGFNELTVFVSFGIILAWGRVSKFGKPLPSG